MDDQAMQSQSEQLPTKELTEAHKALVREARLKEAKIFDDGAKYALLVQMRTLKQTMLAFNMHYEQPCSDKEVGHDSSHNYHDLGDPCYCGSDNCGICLDCGEENHD